MNIQTPGTRIRTKRLELGIKQVALAKLAGISPSSLCDLEKGDSKMPSAEALMGISKALGVSQAWIMTGKDGELETLTLDEEEIIKAARKLTAEQRRAVYQIMRTMNGDG